MIESKCPICTIQGVPFLQTKDYNRRITNEVFLYHKCLSCGLIYLVNVPEDLGKYYPANYYAIPPLAKLKRIARAERYMIEMVKEFVKSGRLLEVGSAFGVFACQAVDAGFNVDCIEMDERCCDYLKNVLGVNVVKSDKPHKVVESMKRHDVIALWHVVEHLANPWECLGALAENLTQGGILVIATPNPEAFQFNLLKADWPHIDAPRHLYLIPANLLIQHLNLLGLKPVMLTSNDKGAQSWNRFGWQRCIMNRFSNKLAQNAAFILGYVVSIPFGLWERKDFNGSAYTIIFQKNVDQ
jgi:2-polyprenyl-3-methyl-5-hydroxy-6-metoxy-1,4-benzoquinol methylase